MTAQHNGRCTPDPRELLRAARLDEYRTFFTSAVRHPAMVGAAAPCSRAVAGTIGQVVPTTGSPVVVELGPGTGSLSDGIHERLPAGARHIGIELGAELVEHLRVHRPWMETVHGDAAELRSLLDKLGVDEVDAVVSSIPWSLLPARERDSILRQSCRALAPHGVFTALTYLPMQHSDGGRRFRQRLHEAFDEVLTHTTWRNVPPILHYICRRPLT